MRTIILLAALCGCGQVIQAPGTSESVVVDLLMPPCPELRCELMYRDECDDELPGCINGERIWCTWWPTAAKPTPEQVVCLAVYEPQL